MWAIIATWRMAKEGIDEAVEILSNKGHAGDAIEAAIKNVEDNPFYKSVGYGGLPNEHGVVELDAAYMDGTSFDIGMVASMQDIANPISVARKLSTLKTNNMLVGRGAREYALKEGFKDKKMLSDRAIIHFKNRLKEDVQELSPYVGHDTVGMVSLDVGGRMVSATSTSGLFMKKTGRVGDSPIIGSGFYVDSNIGGASTTGLGEDLMKGVVSYEIVRLMKEGLHPQAAAEKVCFDLDKELIERRGQAGDISLIALAKDGSWGVASNIKDFSFSVASKTEMNTVYITNRVGDRMVHEVASEAWLENYTATRTAPLEEL